MVEMGPTLQRWRRHHYSQQCKGGPVEITAKMSSRGRITIPKSVRDAMGIAVGDSVLFRVDSSRIMMEPLADFLSLAGTIKVPAAHRNAEWDTVRRAARESRSFVPSAGFPE